MMIYNDSKILPATPAYVKKGVEGKTCAQQHLVSVCSQSCYFLYRPVCGVLDANGQKVYRTFSNDCTFWQANCQSPNQRECHIILVNFNRNRLIIVTT